MFRRVMSSGAAAVAAVAVLGCGLGQPRPGTVQDEAMRAGVTAEQLVRPTDDYFHDMDYNLVDGKRPTFTQPEIEGRNMWMVWTGGADRLWDTLTARSIGSFDLLKTISSHPDPTNSAYSTAYGRHNRWRYLGLVNEPCFKEATGPDPNHFGLWLDVRDTGCPPIRSPTPTGIPVSGSAPAAAPCRSAPTTASPPASSASGCFRIPISTRRPASGGTPSGSTTIRRTTSTASWCGRTASAMSLRVLPRRAEPDPAAGRSREPEMGEAELERRRPVFLVGSRLQLARRQERQQLLLSGAPRLAARARSIRRWSRPTTSTTRGR